MTSLFFPTFGGMSGLDCLRTIDTLHVKQYSLLAESICGLASESKFDIFNDRNERIFQGLETSTICQRFFCEARRRFTLRIIDNNNQDIILLKREFKCCSELTCCANAQCCSQEIVVESPPGTLIGTVSQIKDCCRLVFAIRDANDNHVLTLQGPVICGRASLSCCCGNKFTLIGTDGITEVGTVYRKYRGFLNGSFTSAGTFLIKVPMDLDVKMKAVSLAALFLIRILSACLCCQQ